MAVVIQSRQVIHMDDWDKLVMDTYGKHYCLQQQNGCLERQQIEVMVPGNGRDYANETVPDKINGAEKGVSFGAWLARDPEEWSGSKDDAECLDMFWERNFYPSVEALAKDLYDRGLLPAGRLYINVDW